VERKIILDVDDKKEQYKLTTVADVSSILELNKQERNLNDGFSQKRTMRKVGSIPIDTLIAMGEKGYEILKDDNKLREFLRQHPEYRTSEGSI